MIVIKQILTANRLSDGLVVYLTSTNVWSESAEDALIAVTDEEAKGLEASGKLHEVTQVSGPYLITVEQEGNHILPVSYRERIRAHGPSIREPRAVETVAGHFKPPAAPIHQAAS
jgi:hypothetical protein